MGKVFHIGMGGDGNFAVTGITPNAPEISAGPSSFLKGQFGTGYDESAVRDEAMTNFPVPGNNNSFSR